MSATCSIFRKQKIFLLVYLVCTMVFFVFSYQTWLAEIFIKFAENALKSSRANSSRAKCTHTYLKITGTFESNCMVMSHQHTGCYTDRSFIRATIMTSSWHHCVLTTKPQKRSTWWKKLGGSSFRSGSSWIAMNESRDTYSSEMRCILEDGGMGAWAFLRRQ